MAMFSFFVFQLAMVSLIFSVGPRSVEYFTEKRSVHWKDVWKIAFYFILFFSRFCLFPVLDKEAVCMWGKMFGRILIIALRHISVYDLGCGWHQAHTHTHNQTHTHTHKSVHMNARVRERTHTHTHTNKHAHTQSLTHTWHTNTHTHTLLTLAWFIAADDNS